MISLHLDESAAQIHGFHVELADISLTIIDQANIRVAEAVAVSKSDNEEDGPQVQAFVVINQATNSESQRHLQPLLLGLNLAYMLPTHAGIWRKLPRTSGRIVGRRALMVVSISGAEIIQVMRPANPSIT